MGGVPISLSTLVTVAILLAAQPARGESVPFRALPTFGIEVPVSASAELEEGETTATISDGDVEIRLETKELRRLEDIRPASLPAGFTVTYRRFEKLADDGYHVTYTMLARVRGVHIDLGWHTFIRRRVGGFDLECLVDAKDERGNTRGETICGGLRPIPGRPLPIVPRGEPFIRVREGGAFTKSPDGSAVAIWPNGDVELSGARCATATDRARVEPARRVNVRRRLDVATLHTLLASFARLDFAKLPDHVYGVADAGSQTVALRTGTKWIVKGFDNMLTIDGPRQPEPAAAELVKVIVASVGGIPCTP